MTPNRSPSRMTPFEQTTERRGSRSSSTPRRSRQNILFGTDYEEETYKDILEADVIVVLLKDRPIDEMGDPFRRFILSMAVAFFGRRKRERCLNASKAPSFLNSAFLFALSLPQSFIKTSNDLLMRKS